MKFFFVTVVALLFESGSRARKRICPLVERLWLMKEKFVFNFILIKIFRTKIQSSNFQYLFVMHAQPFLIHRWLR
jgi:hypothetical protein